MQHLLDRTTEVVTTLMHYDTERCRVQDFCPHHILLLCGDPRENVGWCATCGKPTDSWQRYPQTTYIEIPAPDAFVRRAQHRPVAVPTLQEFVDIVQGYLQKLSADTDRGTVDFLKHLLEELGIEHHFVTLEAQIRRLERAHSSPPSS